MRSTKRPRRPVRRYRSLLFPGIALLAVFLFWAAFLPPGISTRHPEWKGGKGPPRARMPLKMTVQSV